MDEQEVKYDTAEPRAIRLIRSQMSILNCVIDIISIIFVIVQ